MIIQTAPENEPNLVIMQTDHALMSGAFAAAFGNAEFASLNLAEPMIYVAGHHDEGWAPIDARFEQDAKTGLPYHLTGTPIPYLVQTSAGSPAFNEKHHPYSGIMSSMHTYGLFHGRYGLSDKVIIELIPAAHKTAVSVMLQAELDRQARLKTEMAADPALAPLITEEMLFHNYKLLQFFDTLALYFHMVHEAARGDSYFENVPRTVGDDVTITIRRVEKGIYALAPYPFRETGMAFSYIGRPMTPHPIGTDLKLLMAETTPVSETIILEAG